jgi:hypothetical protein
MLLRRPHVPLCYYLPFVVSTLVTTHDSRTVWRDRWRNVQLVPRWRITALRRIGGIFGLKSFHGNTGHQPGGWFNKEINLAACRV